MPCHSLWSWLSILGTVWMLISGPTQNCILTRHLHLTEIQRRSGVCVPERGGHPKSGRTQADIYITREHLAETISFQIVTWLLHGSAGRERQRQRERERERERERL
jgi:hypothetical protein